MEKNRFISFIILIIALAFIVYVVVENLNEEEITNQEIITTSESAKDEKQSPTAPFIETDEIGLIRGMFAPDFSLPILGTDNEKALSDFRGDIIVLNLWASWCPPCRDEMPDLIKLHEQYKDKGVKVLGVNMGTLEKNEQSVQEFMEEFAVPFPNFVDKPIDALNQRGIVESLYQVHSIPATYILDENGRIFIAIRGKVNFTILENEVNKVLKKQ